MQVLYKNSKMAKQAKDEGSLSRAYGQSGRWIAKCIQVLKAVPNLAEMFTPFFRRFRCHMLHGDKKGTFSIDERDPYRVLFEPKPPVPYADDGGIDTGRVVSVVVTDLHVDTHE